MSLYAVILQAFFTASPNDPMLTDCSCPTDSACNTYSFLQVVRAVLCHVTQRSFRIEVKMFQPLL